MDIQNNDVTIQIDAKDLSGKRLRVSDCDVFIVHVFTDDPKRYLSFSKRDMLMTEFVDELTVPAHQMRNLNSGVVQYTYDYLPINHNCKYENVDIEVGDTCDNPFHLHHKHHLHENLIHSKIVVTGVYWRNINHPHPNHPLNSVTLFDIERLQREIDAERISREKDIQDLSSQFGEDFDEKLNAEIERSKAEDARINTTLEALGLTLGELGGNVGDNQEQNKTDITQNKVDIASEIARATAKETQLQQAIDGEISRAKAQEEVIATTLQMEKERATANEQNINDRLVSLTDRYEANKELVSESLKSEIERAKATESALNDKIQGVVKDLATEVSRAAEKDIEHTNLVTTESNRAQAVENKIATDLETEVNRAKDAEKHILDEVHDVQNTVSNLATATNVYTKSEVDNKVNEVKNDLATLQNDFNNHLTTSNELSEKVSSLVGDMDKAKSDILAEVAKCDAENNKLATELQTLSDSTYTKTETDNIVNGINSELETLKNWKDNHVDNTTELKDKVTKLVADTEKLSTDLSNETTARINADTTLETKVSVAEGKVDAEAERAKAQEALLSDSVAEIKENATAKHTELSDAIAETNANLTLEIARAKAQEKVNSDAIEIINGDSETSGSIKKSLADSKSYTDAEIAKLSLAKDTEIADTLKSYATNEAVDKKISEVVGSAPEALDTLGKISNALSQDNDAITAINGVLSGKANSEDVYTKSEIDTAINSVNNALSTLETKSENADTTINERINDLVTKVNGIEANADTNNSALSDTITAEETRAKASEKTISDKLDSEVEKVNEKVTELSAKLIEEIAKSDAKDTEIDANISALNTLLTNVETKVDNEVIRATTKDNELVAKDAELEAKIQANTDNISSEIARSKQVEKELNDKINSINLGDTNSNLSAEIDRATGAEATIQSNLDAEVTRAKAVEETLTNSISDEVARAKQAEKTLEDKINSIDLDGANSSISSLNDKVDSEIARAKAQEKINSDNIATLQSSVSGLNDSVTSINSNLTQAIADSNAKDTEIEGKVTANETAISALQTKVDSIDLTPLNNAISALDSKVDNSVSTLQTNVDNEVLRASAAEKANADNITKLSGDIKAVEDKVNAIDFTPVTNSISTLETKVDNEITRAQNAEKINSDNIATLQTSVSGINDSLTSVNASLSQLQADSSAKDTEIESNLATEKTRAENAEKALEDKIAVINGDNETVGSIAHAIHDANHYTDDEIAKVNLTINAHVADAENKYQPKGDYLTEHQDISNLATKSEVESSIQKVVGAAPLALDTLEEIANKLGDNDDVVAGIVNTLADKANSSDVYTKAEVDKAIEDVDVSEQLKDYATKSEVEEAIAEIDVTEQLKDYAKVEDCSIIVDENGNRLPKLIIDFSDEPEDDLGQRLYTKVEVDSKFATKEELEEAIEAIEIGGSNDVDLTDYYTKSEIDNKIADIDVPETDLSNYYNKTQVQQLLSERALKNSVILMQNDIDEINNTLSNKANSSEVYSKAEADNKFAQIWSGSQSEYDAIAEKNNNTIYIILG